MTNKQKFIKMSALASLTAFVAMSALVSMGTRPALAATPNNPACLGHDFSGYAQNGSMFADFISFLATMTQGIGNEIQSHLAGLVPDSTIPNSCNN